MPSERKFFGNGVYPHANAPLVFDGWFPGENERGLGEIGLFCERLHLRIRQSASVLDDGKRVSLQRVLGKNIDLNKR